VVGLLVGLLVPSLHSQSTVPVNERTEPRGSSTSTAQGPIELSPFEVREDLDTGYAAQNTVAGSRLNTSLLDTPAAISVFTAQFIEDIGATNVDDLVEYSVNTRNNLLDGGNNQLTNGDPIINIRGISAGSSTQGTGGGRFTNFFPSSFTQDAYNLERAELTRGPNSVLYGVGLPAGGFNVSTKKADVRRAKYATSYRFGSYHQARGTIDINQPILQDAVAIRLNAIAEKRNDWHPYAFKNDLRWSVAARWQIARHTRLDVEHERGDRKFSTAPQLGMLDSLTPWLAAGRRLKTTTGAALPANAGLQSLVSPTFLRYDLSTGVLYNLQNQSVSAPAGATPGVVAATGEQQSMLTDFDLVPRNVFLGGPAYGTTNTFNRTTVILSHEIVRNLSVEAAFNRESNETHGVNQSPVSGANLQIFADTNTLLPNGAPNPHAGQFYTEAISTQQNIYNTNSDYRVSAVYELDFSKDAGLRRWLGDHRFAALYEYRDDPRYTNPLTELLVLNPVSTAMPDAGANQLIRRTYFDLNGPVAKMAMADTRKFPLEGVPNQATGRPVSSAFLPANDPRDTIVRTNTQMLVWQGQFLRARIVPMIGYRKDRIANFDSVAARTPAFGPFAQGMRYAVRNKDADYGSGITRTPGVVAHPFKWMALFYNHSSAFSLPARTVRLFPQTLAATDFEGGRSVAGETADYGLKFPVWKNKVFATVTYYETKARDQARNGGLGTYKTGIPNIWTTLNNAGVLAANRISLDSVTSPIAAAQASSFDNQSKGYEFELTANPTPNWRLLLNFSTNKTIESNSALEIRNYYAANSPFWLEGTRARLVVNGTPGQLATTQNDPNLLTIYKSLQDQLAALDDQFVSSDGARAFGVPVAAGNVRTSYGFREGRLKGISVGAGARWRGERVLAYSSSNPATRREIRSDAQLTLDGDVSYRRKVALLGRSYELTVQLNLTNLLANDDLIYTGAYTSGRYRTFSIPAPRAWFVTTTAKF
jgi:iron complex outermembrane recepter protein